jgi:hypothetical protein
MVRGFNPNENDPVKHLFDSALRLFRSRERISSQRAMELVQRWYAAPAYNKIFEVFSKMGQQPPKIKLKKNCR